MMVLHTTPVVTGEVAGGGDLTQPDSPPLLYLYGNDMIAHVNLPHGKGTRQVVIKFDAAAVLRGLADVLDSRKP